MTRSSRRYRHAYLLFGLLPACISVFDDELPVGSMNPLDGGVDIDLGISDLGGMDGGVSPIADSGMMTVLRPDATLIINEVLYDPPNDMPGDANADGTRSPDDDEFVELVNVSTGTVDLSGYRFYDTTALNMNMPRHTVEAGTLLGPDEALVVFGGGTPNGSFGGATVQTANGFEGRLNLNNAGDFLTVINALGDTVLEFDIEPLSNNPDESYTREPDLVGDFEQHGRIVDGVLYSPGTKIDGTPF